MRRSLEQIIEGMVRKIFLKKQLVLPDHPLVLLLQKVNCISKQHGIIYNF